MAGVRVPRIPLQCRIPRPAREKPEEAPRNDPREDATQEWSRHARDHSQRERHTARLVRILQTQLTLRVPEARRMDPHEATQHLAETIEAQGSWSWMGSLT